MRFKSYIYISMLISLSSLYGMWWTNCPSSMLGNMFPDDYDNMKFETFRNCLQQLDNLIGSEAYDKRKTIIHCLVTYWDIDPNNVMYQDKRNPLYDSIIFKNIAFAQYLLEKGEKPDEKTLKIVEGNAVLIALLKTEK